MLLIEKVGALGFSVGLLESSWCTVGIRKTIVMILLDFIQNAIDSSRSKVAQNR